MPDYILYHYIPQYTPVNDLIRKSVSMLTLVDGSYVSSVIEEDYRRNSVITWL